MNGDGKIPTFGDRAEISLSRGGSVTVRRVGRLEMVKIARCVNYQAGDSDSEMDFGLHVFLMAVVAITGPDLPATLRQRHPVLGDIAAEDVYNLPSDDECRAIVSFARTGTLTAEQSGN
jgi:hypothetical protein